MTTLFFIGDLRSSGRSAMRCGAFREMGIRVHAFATCDAAQDDSRSAPLIDRVLHQLHLPRDRVHAGHKAIELMRSVRPDVIWVDNARTLRPAVLRMAHALHPGTRLAWFSEDDMFARHNQSWFFRRALPLYDVVFTTKSFGARSTELPALGAKRVIHLDNTFDSKVHRPLALSDAERGAFGAECGFIGTFESERANSMLALARADISVRIWGNGWRHISGTHPNLRIEGRALLDDDYVRGICATKVNLCMLRKVNRDLQTSRTMEIPACGAFMLAERTVEHQRLFEEGKEAEFFDVESPIELLEKVKYYLAHEPEREAIAAAGRRRCLESGYDMARSLSRALEQVLR